MSDLIAQVQGLMQRVNSLEAEVRVLRSANPLSKRAIVGKDYVARLYECSEDAVVKGRRGTSELRNKRVRFNPDGWVKETVDAAHKEFIKTAPERAIEAEKAANARKRK